MQIIAGWCNTFHNERNCDRATYLEMLPGKFRRSPRNWIFSLNLKG
jgi:hypothetical protein